MRKKKKFQNSLGRARPLIWEKYTVVLVVGVGVGGTEK